MVPDSLTNRGTAFTAAERDALDLEGLLPARVETLAEQVSRVMANLREKPTPIDKYLYLQQVRDANEVLFQRAALDNLAEILPLVYTPTVGQACLEWGRRFVRPHGLTITPRDRGRVAALLRNWPHRDVGMIVATDGGRILGLGDLGANGMGIPVGKLALYTLCAGIDPARCLPVMLDVGTDNVALRDDPFYLGLREPRLTGPAYDELLDEFVAAVRSEFPAAVLQFEDFGNANAFRLLERHRDRLACFNDDIQGTGAMGLAGLLAASRITGRGLAEERLLFVGAGEANLGIGLALVAALRARGLGEEEARRRCLYFDSRGAVVSSRTDLPEHKRRFAQARAAQSGLADVIDEFRPTALIGACGRGGRFDAQVLAALCRHERQPLVLALSNPTTQMECTAAAVYAASEGRAVFASGSPCEALTVAGQVYAPGQANNAHVFPGVGLGLVVSGAARVSDAMFLAAAGALAACVGEADLAEGRIFPPAARLRQTAQAVAVAVARVAFESGLATAREPADLGGAVAAAMWRPEYPA